MERQTFNRIKRIYADKAHVIIELYRDKLKSPDETDVIRLSYLDAAKRARALNAMLHKLPAKDAAIGFEIIDNVIAACKEAKQQATRIGGAIGSALINNDIDDTKFNSITSEISEEPKELGPEQ